MKKPQYVSLWCSHGARGYDWKATEGCHLTCTAGGTLDRGADNRRKPEEYQSRIKRKKMKGDKKTPPWFVHAMDPQSDRKRRFNAVNMIVVVREKCTDLKNKANGNDLWVILAKQMPKTQRTIRSRKGDMNRRQIACKNHESSWLRSLRGSGDNCENLGVIRVARWYCKPSRSYCDKKRVQIEERHRNLHRELGRTVKARSLRCWLLVWLSETDIKWNRITFFRRQWRRRYVEWPNQVRWMKMCDHREYLVWHHFKKEHITELERRI